MKLRSYIFLMLLLPAFVACKKEQQRELPKFSEITLSPSKAVYALGDTVQASITMLSPGDLSLKKATYWFYTSWWGSDPEKTADFCTPDTIAGTICFSSGKISLTQAGEVRIYFWGRLEYPDWDFQPIQIPVTLNVE
ncbi:MAG: hypothetical protein IJQ18_04205 [Paludibacteraceae bacterium]|nr:hypothetical protein [Paludibacteraceae bacterium]